MQRYQDLHDKIQDLAQQSAESAAIGVDLVNMLSAIKAWEYAEEVRLRQRVMQLDEGASDGKKEGGEKTRDLEQEIFDLKKKLVEKDSLITDGEKLLKVETDRIFQLEQELNNGKMEGGEKTRDLEQEIFDLKKKLVEKDSLITEGEKLLKVETDRIFQLEQEVNKKVSCSQEAARQLTEQIEKCKAKDTEMETLLQSEARKQAQVAACKLEFEGASRALAQSEEQLQAARAENEGLLKNLMVTEAQVAACKLEFESASRALAKSEENLQAARAENESILKNVMLVSDEVLGGQGIFLL
jgi:chromosome segregation protein